MAALLDNLELLARRDFAALKRVCGVDDEDLADMVAEIRRLDPKPGLRFGGGPIQPVVPDVIVRQAPDGGWLVELNPRGAAARARQPDLLRQGVATGQDRARKRPTSPIACRPRTG